MQQQCVSRLEQLENRQLLTAGEFSILGATSDTGFNPDSDAFVRYDRETDTLHLRVRGNISLDKLSLEVDTKGFLEREFLTNQVIFADTTVRLTDAIDFRRGEGLGGDPDYADFLVTDFLFRISLRATNQTAPNAINTRSKATSVAEAERDTTTIRLVRSFDPIGDVEFLSEVGEVAFDRLNAPAIEIRGPENNEALIDQDIPFTVDLVNLPRTEHRVTVTITGEGDPIIKQFEFTTDQSRNRQVQFNQLFTTAGQKQVSVQVESIGGSTTSFAPTVLEIREPEPATGRLPGDPLVGANNLLRVNPFDVTLIGGIATTDQESFISIGGVSGSIPSDLFGDLTVRFTGTFLAETDLFDFAGEEPAGDFHAEPIELFRDFLFSEVSGESIDAEFGRQFSVNLNPENLGNDVFFGRLGSRLIDRSFKVELLNDQGTVLDTVQFNKSQIQGFRSDRGNESPDDFGQIRPLNVDVVIGNEFNTLIGGSVFALNNGTVRVTGRVSIDNLLPQLDGAVGVPTIRIDFGDGSEPLVQELFDFSGGNPSATLRGLGLRDSTSLLVFDQSFNHDYTQFGEFDITATVTLPNGRVAAERQTVTILSQPNVSMNITSAVEQPNGPFRIVGRVSNRGNSQSFPVTVHVGDLSRDSFTLDTDANGNFDQLLLLPQNVDDLIPAGEQLARLNAFLEIKSNDHRLSHVPFEIEVVRSGASFVTNTSSSLTFRGFGDFFEIDVPLRITTDQASNVAAVGTVTQVSNVNGRTHTVLNLQNSAVSSVLTGGLFNGRPVQSSRIDSSENFVIRSFFNPPGGGDPMLLETSSFSAGLMVDASGTARPQVTITTASFVNEATNFRPTLGVTGLIGPATLEIEYADGVILQHAINFFTGTGTVFDFPTRQFAQAPGDGPAGDMNFEVRALQNGNIVARSAGKITIRDHGLTGLTPLLAEIKGRSNLASGQLDVELTVVVQDTNPDDELTATIDWGDGIVDEVEIARNPAENFEGRFLLNHTFSQEFLQSRFGEGEIIRPAPVIHVRDNSGTVQQVFVFSFNIDNAAQFRRIGLEVAEDSRLLQARVEAENGAVMGDRRVTANEPFVVDIITGRTDTSIRSEFLNLAEGEEKVVFIDLNQDEQAGGERNGPFIKLVMVGGDGSEANDLFQIEDPDGTRHGRVAYFRVPDARRFANIDRIRLVDLDTNEPLIKYDRTGRFTLEVFIEDADGEREAIGAVDIAVFPQLENVAVREDGSLTGSVSGLGVNEFELIVPETGFRLIRSGDIDPNGADGTFTASLNLDLQGLLRDGGSFLIEVADGALGRTLLPVNIGDPQFDGILLEAPEFVNQGDKFQLDVTLPQPLLDLLAVRGNQPLKLKLDLGDGRVFNVDVFRTRGVINLNLDGSANFEFVPLPFNFETGRLIFVNEDTNELFLTLDNAGPQDIQLFGEGSFGNAIVNVSNIRPSVTPALEVNEAGRLVGVLNIDSENGVELRILGKVINVAPGQQQVPAEDIDPNDGQVFAPAQQINAVIIEDGEAGDEIKLELTLNAEGNTAPQFDNLQVEQQADGSFDVSGDVNDSEGNDTSVIIRDSNGDELGRQTIPGGQGAFNINVRPQGGQGILQATDDQGGIVNILLNFAKSFDLTFPALPPFLKDIPDQELFQNSGFNFTPPDGTTNITATVSTNIGTLSEAGSDDPPAQQTTVTGSFERINQFVNNLLFIPNPGFNGQGNFNFVFEDADDATIRTEVTLDADVESENSPPRIEKAHAKITGDGTFQIFFDVFDPDQDEVTVTIARLFGPPISFTSEEFVAFTDIFSGKAQFATSIKSETLNLPGDVAEGGPYPEIVITATDPFGATDSKTVTLFIADPRIVAQRGDGRFADQSPKAVFQTISINDPDSFAARYEEVAGAENASAIVIFESNGNRFAQGLDGTLINGTNEPVLLPANPGTIETALNSGDDTILIQGVTLPKSNLRSTPGDDLMIIQNTTFTADLSINVGPDEDVGTDNDQVFLDNVTVAGNATVQMGHGNDRIETASVTITGNLEIRGGEGDDHVDASGATVGGTSTIDLATGSDTVIGTAGDDIIRVADGGDSIDGGEGNDQINIEAGNRPVLRDGNQVFVGADNPITLNQIEIVRFTNSSAEPLVIELSDASDDALLQNNGDGSFTLLDRNGTFGGDRTFVPPDSGLIVNAGDGPDQLNFAVATFPVTLNGDGAIDAIEVTIDESGVLNVRDIAGLDDDVTITFLDDSQQLSIVSGAGRIVTSVPNVVVINSFEVRVPLAEIPAAALLVDLLDGNDRLDASQLALPVIAFGGLGNDTLRGGAGHDVLFGGAGDDELRGGNGDDTLVGDIGHDLLAGEDGNDNLNGGRGRDTVSGGRGDDLILTRNDDVLDETADTNLILADAGLTGLGSDNLIGSFTGAILRGNAANNMLSAQSFTGGPVTLIGGDGHDTLIGTQFSDVIFGNGGDDLVRAGAGDDTVSGSDGNDRLFGEDGHDLITGGSGNDQVLGGRGRNTLSGGAGDDLLRGTGFNVLMETAISGQPLVLTDAGLTGVGNDTIEAQLVAALLLGDDGSNAIDASGWSRPATLDGGAGNDTLRGGSAPVTLLGGDGNDVITGGTADDLLRGGEGNDTISGNSGNDVITGDNGDDVLNGNSGRDTLLGGAGNDRLNGFQGNDVLLGEAGNDTLLGAAGRDTLLGGDGNDSLDGGADSDTLAGGTGSNSLIGSPDEIDESFTIDLDSLLAVL